jgi:hypothetical protein
LNIAAPFAGSHTPQCHGQHGLKAAENQSGYNNTSWIPTPVVTAA